MFRERERERERERDYDNEQTSRKYAAITSWTTLPNICSMRLYIRKAH